MLEDRQLRKVLASLPLAPREGPFHRYVLHRYVALALERRMPLQVEAERIEAPYVHVPVGGRLQRVLDLTQPDVLRALETSEDELGRNWRMSNARGTEATSQRLGHAAYVSDRVEAVAYRSIMWPAGTCLAIFPRRLASGSSLEVVDPDGILRERIP